ncbi:MAG: peptide chain release factor N(5)-glutamine methyltransferase [Myxococcales bacterium]|nr:peptide chain release factor N(5)-glutamine methyltransferase [Myxococcales bacterium]
MTAEAPTRPAREKLWTVAELLQWTCDRFTREGLEEPRADALHLLSQALGCERMQIYLRFDQQVDEPARTRLRELILRRLAREPVAYIAGKRGFHALGLDLHVDPRVLIPRPETEHLVDWLLAGLPFAPSPVHVLDIGTGSGAIALAIKHARRDVLVTACDRSDDALAVAGDNATRLGLELTLLRSDLLAAVPRPELGFDAIAANLPYIPTADIADLQPEVRRFEPHLALDGGPDGLDLVQRLIADSPAFLAPGARLLLEIGAGQAEATRAALAQRGFVEVDTRRDLAGIERVVAGTWP